MMSKIKHLFQRLGKEIKVFFPDVKEFGFKVAFYRAVDFLFPRPKTKAYINALSDYMEKELSPLTEKYKNGYVPENPQKLFDMNGKIPVFVCWWQGEEKMPPLVSACVGRIKKKIPCDYAQLHLITYENYSDYVELPEYVVEKHKNGTISRAHFSDVLRFSLLKTYGGMWIDSTVFLSDNFNFDFLNREFYTQKYEFSEECPHEACMGKWCGFFLCGQANLQLFDFVYDSLLFWWQKHDRVVDYVFFDYIIKVGYNNFPQIKETIDSVEPNNKNIWLLSQHLNDAFEKNEYEKILNSNGFFKLAHGAMCKENDENGNLTVYGHIISEVKNA